MSNRYLKPKNVKEAMETIQKLFNQYRHAALTKELLDYHINLANRLQTDIYREAVRENDKKQLADLANMIVVMHTWTKLRLSNQPFNGKMKNFKLVSQNQPKFKQHVHKIKGNHNYRASRH